MNCIFLLLLLGCYGGCGNGRGCGNGCGCWNGMDCCGRPERGGCHEHRHHRHEKEKPCCEPRNDGCGGRDDGRERPCCEPEPCGCAREERECGCDAPSSGIIPPPWQDYPRFPRRDNGEDCGCEQ